MFEDPTTFAFLHLHNSSSPHSSNINTESTGESETAMIFPQTLLNNDPPVCGVGAPVSVLSQGLASYTKQPLTRHYNDTNSISSPHSLAALRQKLFSISQMFVSRTLDPPSPGSFEVTQEVRSMISAEIGSLGKQEHRQSKAISFNHFPQLARFRTVNEALTQVSEDGGKKTGWKSDLQIAMALHRYLRAVTSVVQPILKQLAPTVRQELELLGTLESSLNNELLHSEKRIVTSTPTTGMSSAATFLEIRRLKREQAVIMERKSEAEGEITKLEKKLTETNSKILAVEEKLRRKRGLMGGKLTQPSIKDELTEDDAPFQSPEATSTVRGMILQTRNMRTQIDVLNASLRAFRASKPNYIDT